MKNKLFKKQRGIILFSVLAVSLICSIIIASMLSMASQQIYDVKLSKKRNQALLVAYSGIEKVKFEMQKSFMEHFNTEPMPGSLEKLNWFDSWSESQIGGAGTYYLPQQEELRNGSYVAKITAVINEVNGQRDVILKVIADINGHKRAIEERVRFGLGRSTVFDYAYFINNFGWLWGGGNFKIYGSVRANGNFSVDHCFLYGDIIASINDEISAAGDIEYSGSSSMKNKPLSVYYNMPNDRKRPGNPPHENYDGDWPMGYDGNQDHTPRQELLEMPFLGNLSNYKALAIRRGGTLKQNGTTLVDAVYAGKGPDDVEDTADDGMLVLVGTKSKPIVLDGPVVIEKDLVIKGVITGQGTIYTGRNIHVIGDLEYDNPPSWPKGGDLNPEQTAINNQSKDLICFASKGNVIFGDYNDNKFDACSYYLTPAFTNPYKTDPSDANNGYDTDDNPSNGYLFDGDYTAHDGGDMITGDPVEEEAQEEMALAGTFETYNDGGNGYAIASNKNNIKNVNVNDVVELAGKEYTITNIDKAKMRLNKIVPNPKNSTTGKIPGKEGGFTVPTEDRKFYECSNNKAFDDASPTCNIKLVDGVFYTNHLLGGKLGTLHLNGGIIARDEACIVSGNFQLTWDIRTGSQSKDGSNFDIGLPMSMRKPHTIISRECSCDDQ